MAFSVSPAGAELIYATVAGNILLSFDSATPLTQSQVPITGHQAGESILGIDLRPATEQLYALGRTSGLYTINPATTLSGWGLALMGALLAALGYLVTRSGTSGA